ncbi:MAG: hypothetical protein M1816_000409 [Peltula sp. TS41687]|nr:MAG: hypothetical protein M1816_000409 [Peltula sp. TS41687]
MTTRSASHAGSWYSASKATLSSQLDQWLDQVPSSIEGVGPLPVSGARIIIAPHAGYAYSGPTAAWAYRALDLSKAKRIFLLGPSHHVYMSGCALTRCAVYQTPLGNLNIDRDTVAELHRTGKFEWMSLGADEAEHSLEMHLPYIYKMLSRTFPSPAQYPPLTPILVGSTNPTIERSYGGLLAPYLADPSSVFIISSDFCHWGSRFNYTYYVPGDSSSPADGYSLKARDKAPTNPPIHGSIRLLDEACIEAIESGDHDEFLSIVEDTGNTICGRHPIGLVMAAIWEVLRREEEIKEEGDDDEGDDARRGRFRFVRYERSSECVSVRDSSVSYVSGFAVL